MSNNIGKGVIVNNKFVNNNQIYYTSMMSPLGEIFIAKSETGLCRISFGNIDAAGFIEDIETRFKKVAKRDPKMLDYITEEMQRYFQQKQYVFNFRLDLGFSTHFQKKVLLKAKEIPMGQVISYSDLAKQIGLPKGYRAVGQALGRNPIPVVIPCHRVIASDGSLGGFTGGMQYKIRLLKLEGFEIDGSERRIGRDRK